jgi:hypothetical protein
MDKLSYIDIELAIANQFGYRQNIIVPNVSWGLLGQMEVDLLIVSQSGYCTEIEIKMSNGDIEKDKKKWHRIRAGENNGIRHPLITRTFFAIPENLNIEHIPEWAGIITLKKVNDQVMTKTVRGAKRNPKSRKIRDDEKLKLLHLGCMRIWSLKEHNNCKGE